MLVNVVLSDKIELNAAQIGIIFDPEPSVLHMKHKKSRIPYCMHFSLFSLNNGDVLLGGLGFAQKVLSVLCGFISNCNVLALSLDG